MPIGGGPGQSRWLSALGSWLGDQSKNIQENYNFDKISDSLVEDDGFAAPMNKAAGYAIKGLSQVARPIAGIGGALGNVMSEAGSERLAGEDRQMPSVLEAAMTEQATGPKTLRETLTPLDVAGVAAGGVASATAKTLPKIARIAGLADLGLSGADAALGVGDVKQGVEQGDYARAAMGVARVAGNAYGATKAYKDLPFKRGTSIPEPQAQMPLIEQILGGTKPGKLTTEYVGKDTAGNPYSLEMYTDERGNTSALSRERIRSANEDPHVQVALAEQAQFFRMGDAEEADTMLSGLTDVVKGDDPNIPDAMNYINSGNLRGFLTESKRRGMTYAGPDRQTTGGGGAPYWFNPWEVAKDAEKFVDTVRDVMVPQAEANKLLSVMDPEDAKYLDASRNGEDYNAQRELLIKAKLYLKQAMYTAGHERIGHLPADSSHTATGAGDYRTQIKSYSDTPVMDTPLLKIQETTDTFGKVHNWWLEQMADPNKMKGIKGLMQSENFEARIVEWYRAMNPAEDLSDLPMKVAKRQDRVIGRPEAAKAMAEQDVHKVVEADEPLPPTPPGSVPPGSSGGEPQGPALPSLAKRIKESMKANRFAANQNEMKMRQLNKLKAEALRDNEAKYAGQQITTEEFHSERARIKGQNYGLIEKVQQMPITEAEKAALTEQISTQAADDAFIRDRTQTAMQKMIAGERLEDNEIKLIRETIGERMRINEEDPAIVKIGKFFANATGSARALMTAYDLSAAGRQALYAGVMNPKAVKEAFVAQIKALRMTRPEFDSMMARLKDPMYNPFAEVSEAAGLHFSETMAHATGKQEEAFYNGKWAEAIPGVRQSEQAYIAYLNKMRVELFNKHAKVIMDSGEELIDPMTGTASQKMKDLAYMVNTLTGRGELSLLHISPNSMVGKKMGLTEAYTPGKEAGDKLHEGLTRVFFAPRFAASRAALMRDTVQAMIGGGLDPAISKIYMKNVVGTITAVTSTMAALAAMGVGTFNSDPRKKDFGVLKVGNTRYDSYGGLKQWAKIVSLIGTDQYFSGKYSVKQTYGEKIGSKTKTGEVGRFVQGKLSPAAGFLLEALTGEDFMGRKSQLMRNAYEHSFPMVIQTIAEAVEANEADQLPLAVPLSVVGVGVNSYSDKRFKR